MPACSMDAVMAVQTAKPGKHMEDILSISDKRNQDSNEQKNTDKLLHDSLLF